METFLISGISNSFLFLWCSKDSSSHHLTWHSIQLSFQNRRSHTLTSAVSSVSNPKVSQTSRGRYIIYIIMAVRVAGLRCCLVSCSLFLVVLPPSRPWQVIPLSLSFQPFCFGTFSYCWSFMKCMKMSCQATTSSGCTASWPWSLRRWSPANFLSGGSKLPLDTAERDKW